MGEGGFDFRRDGSEGLERGGRGGDRAADHEPIRSRVDRLGGGHHALLVAGFAAGGAHAGSYDDKGVSELFPQWTDFARTGDDPAQAALEAHPGEAHDLVLRRIGDACGGKGFRVHAGEHGDAENEHAGVLRGTDGICHHAGTAAQVDRRHFRSQSGCGAHRLPRGVWDVMELEVEKHAGSEGFEIADDGGTLGGEKLESDLEQATFAEEGVRKALGGIGVRGIEGDDDFFLRGAGRGGHLSRRMTLDAPAKVNLSLRVLERRSDGFHAIETLMAPLALADRLEVELKDGEGVDFSCSDPALPMDGTNLACRAVEAFAKATGRKIGVRIHLEKHIPHGAGLGGGSSDAAAVLRALDMLLETEFEVEELEALAGTIGSDVPFFIRGVPAMCRGRGEVVEPLEGIPAAEILLVKPPFPVSTAWAYGAWAASKKSCETFPALWGSIRMENDLEAPVFSKHLQLPVLKHWLGAQPGVAAAMMSGSGSTIFAVCDGPVEGIEERVRAEFGGSFGAWRTRIVC